MVCRLGSLQPLTDDLWKNTMLEFDYTEDARASTRGEKITYYVFLLLMLLFFSLEVFTDFDRRKLGGIIFLVAWVPLTFLHEFGHAIVSKLVGWKVNEYVVGYGKVLKEFHYKETKVQLRMVPLGGYILPGFTEENWGRGKSALVYFAGPGIELMVFFVIYALIGFEKFLNPSSDYLHIVLQGIGLSALTGAILNLIPYSAITEKGETPNDGLGIIYSLFGRRS